MKKAVLSGLALASFGLLALHARDASACGGCFVPPESSSVVTDHRMVLTVSVAQTTLYDQIKYAGDPASFAWVLPIVGKVDIGLSADTLFGALDQTTRVAILPPPRNCPPPPACLNERGGATSADAGFLASSDGGVTVLGTAVVGPYLTVQLRASDSGSLTKWLADNGFSIPASVSPVISGYVSENYDFLAMKLVPGKGVRDMRPVRVTTSGAAPVLPLRMVAAGTGAVVGITLWVVAEGRYEPQNFPRFYIPTSDLVWDWNQNRSNYTELRQIQNDLGKGRIWELEASIAVNRASIASAAKYPVYTGGPAPPASGYDPIKDENGNVVKSAVEAADLDIATLFSGIATGKEKVTRIRADLAHQALDQDLVLLASSDQSIVPTLRQVTRELNQPLCPVYEGCTQVGTAPRDQAREDASGSDGASLEGGGMGCSSARATPLGDRLLLGAGLGFLTLAIVRKRRGSLDRRG